MESKKTKNGNHDGPAFRCKSHGFTFSKSRKWTVWSELTRRNDVKCLARALSDAHSQLRSLFAPNDPWAKGGCSRSHLRPINRVCQNFIFYFKFSLPLLVRGDGEKFQHDVLGSRGNQGWRKPIFTDSSWRKGFQRRSAQRLAVKRHISYLSPISQARQWTHWWDKKSLRVLYETQWLMVSDLGAFKCSLLSKFCCEIVPTSDFNFGKPNSFMYSPGKVENGILPTWLRHSGLSAWGIQIGPFAAWWANCILKIFQFLSFILGSSFHLFLAPWKWGNGILPAWVRYTQYTL